MQRFDPTVEGADVDPVTIAVETWRKTHHLIKDDEFENVKKITNMVMFARAICLDYRQRFPHYVKGGHNITVAKRSNFLSRLDKGWFWKLHIRDKNFDPKIVLPHLQRFGLQIYSYDVTNRPHSYSVPDITIEVFMAFEDFPVMCVWRRLHDLDSGDRSKWSKGDSF
jgi:hypothetical protein